MKKLRRVFGSMSALGGSNESKKKNRSTSIGEGEQNPTIVIGDDANGAGPSTGASLTTYTSYKTSSLDSLNKLNNHHLLRFPEELSLDCFFSKLHRAAYDGDDEKLEKSLKKCSVDLQDSSGFSPLHLAASRGKRDTLSLLLDNGATIDIRDNSGSTPLMESVKGCHKTTVVRLLKRKASVFIQDEGGNTVLHYSCLLPCSDDADAITKSLLVKGRHGDSGTNLSDLTNELGRTALHHASIRANLSSCVKLLEGGAKIDCQDKNDVTPLMFAAESGDVKLVDCLLNYSADTSLRDNKGFTAADHARISGNDYLKEMIEKASPEEQRPETLKMEEEAQFSPLEGTPDDKTIKTAKEETSSWGSSPEKSTNDKQDFTKFLPQSPVESTTGSPRDVLNDSCGSELGPPKPPRLNNSMSFDLSDNFEEESVIDEDPIEVPKEEDDMRDLGSPDCPTDSVSLKFEIEEQKKIFDTGTSQDSAHFTQDIIECENSIPDINSPIYQEQTKKSKKEDDYFSNDILDDIQFDTSEEISLSYGGKSVDENLKDIEDGLEKCIAKIGEKCEKVNEECELDDKSDNEMDEVKNPNVNEQLSSKTKSSSGASTDCDEISEETDNKSNKDHTDHMEYCKETEIINHESASISKKSIDFEESPELIQEEPPTVFDRVLENEDESQQKSEDSNDSKEENEMTGENSGLHILKEGEKLSDVHSPTNSYEWGTLGRRDTMHGIEEIWTANPSLEIETDNYGKTAPSLEVETDNYGKTAPSLEVENDNIVKENQEAKLVIDDEISSVEDFEESSSVKGAGSIVFSRSLTDLDGTLDDQLEVLPSDFEEVSPCSRSNEDDFKTEIEKKFDFDKNKLCEKDSDEIDCPTERAETDDKNDIVRESVKELELNGRDDKQCGSSKIKESKRDSLTISDLFTGRNKFKRSQSVCVDRSKPRSVKREKIRNKRSSMMAEETKSFKSLDFSGLKEDSNEEEESIEDEFISYFGSDMVDSSTPRKNEKNDFGKKIDLMLPFSMIPNAMDVPDNIQYMVRELRLKLMREMAINEETQKKVEIFQKNKQEIEEKVEELEGNEVKLQREAISFKAANELLKLQGTLKNQESILSKNSLIELEKTYKTLLEEVLDLKRNGVTSDLKFEELSACLEILCTVNEKLQQQNLQPTDVNTSTRTNECQTSIETENVSSQVTPRKESAKVTEVIGIEEGTQVTPRDEFDSMGALSLVSQGNSPIFINIESSDIGIQTTQSLSTESELPLTETEHTDIGIQVTPLPSTEMEYTDIGIQVTELPSTETEHTDIGIQVTPLPSAEMEYTDIGIQVTELPSTESENTDIGIQVTQLPSTESEYTDIGIQVTPIISLTELDHVNSDTQVTSLESHSADGANISSQRNSTELETCHKCSINKVTSSLLVQTDDTVVKESEEIGVQTDYQEVISKSIQIQTNELECEESGCQTDEIHENLKQTDLRTGDSQTDLITTEEKGCQVNTQDELPIKYSEKEVKTISIQTIPPITISQGYQTDDDLRMYESKNENLDAVTQTSQPPLSYNASSQVNLSFGESTGRKATNYVRFANCDEEVEAPNPVKVRDYLNLSLDSADLGSSVHSGNLAAQSVTSLNISDESFFRNYSGGKSPSNEKYLQNNRNCSPKLINFSIERLERIMYKLQKIEDERFEMVDQSAQLSSTRSDNYAEFHESLSADLKNVQCRIDEVKNFYETDSELKKVHNDKLEKLIDLMSDIANSKESSSAIDVKEFTSLVNDMQKSINIKLDDVLDFDVKTDGISDLQEKLHNLETNLNELPHTLTPVIDKVLENRNNDLSQDLLSRLENEKILSLENNLAIKFNDLGSGLEELKNAIQQIPNLVDRTTDLQQVEKLKEIVEQNGQVLDRKISNLLSSIEHSSKNQSQVEAHEDIISDESSRLLHFDNQSDESNTTFTKKRQLEHQEKTNELLAKAVRLEDQLKYSNSELVEEKNKNQHLNLQFTSLTKNVQYLQEQLSFAHKDKIRTENLSLEIDIIKSERRDMENEINLLKDKLDRKDTEVKKQELYLRRMKEELKVLQEVNTDLEIELESSVASQTKTQERSKRSEIKCLKLKNEVESLKLRLDEKERLLDDTELKMEQCKKEVTNEVKKELELNRNLNKLNASMEEKDGELANLRMKMEDVVREVDVKRNFIRELQEKLQKLSSDKHELSVEFEMLKNRSASSELEQDRLDFNVTLLRKSQEDYKNLQAKIQSDYIPRASLSVYKQEIESKCLLQYSEKIARMEMEAESSFSREITLKEKFVAYQDSMAKQMEELDEEILRLRAKLSLHSNKNDDWRRRHDRALDYVRNSHMDHSMKILELDLLPTRDTSNVSRLNLGSNVSRLNLGSNVSRLNLGPKSPTKPNHDFQTSSNISSQNLRASNENELLLERSSTRKTLGHLDRSLNEVYEETHGHFKGKTHVKGIGTEKTFDDYVGMLTKKYLN